MASSLSSLRALLGSPADSGYELVHYGGMIAHKARMDAYVEALRRFVRAESVVADLGTGSGIFALIAARLGARRVFAIEPDEVIQLAKELAVANAVADRIEFIQDLSTNLELPERADVIVFDLSGSLPLYDGHLPSVADARRRLLRDGGVLLPASDTLWGALVSAPELYDRRLGIWSQRPYGIDHAPGRRLVASKRWTTWLDPEQLLTEPQSWAVLDYRVLEDPSVSGELAWSADGQSPAHGLCLWFDRMLLEGVGFSNAPGQPKGVYQHTFLPFETPLEIAEGDEVRVRLRAAYVADDYVWRWSVRATRGEQVQAEFDQSSFESQILSSSRLKRGSVSHVPKLRAEGEVVRATLELMDGRRSLAEIAMEVAARFPRRFVDGEAALGIVTDLSQQLSE
jgi:protein arginine N-methyltransferase 1